MVSSARWAIWATQRIQKMALSSAELYLIQLNTQTALRLSQPFSKALAKPFSRRALVKSHLQWMIVTSFGPTQTTLIAPIKNCMTLASPRWTIIAKAKSLWSIEIPKVKFWLLLLSSFGSMSYACTRFLIFWCFNLALPQSRLRMWGKRLLLLPCQA